MARAWLCVRYLICFTWHPPTQRLRWGAYCPYCGLCWSRSC